MACLACPDISFAVSSLARHSKRPGLSHWQEVLQVWRYLSGTKNLTITIGPQSITERLVCFSEAMWAEDPETRISQSGFICTFKGSPLYWTSKQQQCITHSSTESECLSLSSCHLEARWLQQLIEDIYCVNFKFPLHLINNKGLNDKIKKFGSSLKAKHIDIKTKSLQDDFKAGLIDVKLILSLSMSANALTKAANKTSNVRLINTFSSVIH